MPRFARAFPFPVASLVLTVVALLTACTSKGHDERASAWSVGQALATRNATFAETLAPARFVDDASRPGGAVARTWANVTKARGLTFGARLPTAADGTIDVGLATPAEARSASTRGDFVLWVTHEGLAPAPLDREGDGATYHDVAPSCDLLVGASDARAEWFYLLRDAGAPTRFAMHLALPIGLPRAMLDASGALAFLDARGKTRLRIPLPSLVDARGTRRDVAMTWDEANARITLAIDTRDLTFPVLVDPSVAHPLWEQGAVNATSVPPATTAFPIVYDAALSASLLFTSSSSGGPINVLWSWDGTNWTKSTLTSALPARSGGAITYDDARGKLVVFGGTVNGAYVNETWEWDGTTWTQQTPATSPPARNSAAFTYDTDRQRAVLFSGNTGNALAFPSDTWEWDGTNWTETALTTSPGGRTGTTMAYSHAIGKVVLFGGERDNYNTAGDTWEYDGTNWAQITLPAGSTPHVRLSGAMAYDRPRGQIVLFGGANFLNPTYPTTQLRADTWEWDGSMWTEITTATSPSARQGATMTFDAARGQTVLFGGHGDDGGYLDDTWLYDQIGASCTTGDTCDLGSCVDGVCCQQAACGPCQACNLSGSEGTCTNVAAGSQDPDSCVSPNICTALGSCGAQQGSTCTMNSDCASNFCADGVCCDSACTGTCQACAMSRGLSEDGSCAFAPVGTPGRTACANDFVCNGKSTTCPGTCSDDTSCATGFYCNAAGACVAQKTNGASCNDNAGADCLAAGCADCNVGHCVDGACCASCGGSTPLGSPCGLDDQCMSDHCVGGICCQDQCATTGSDGGAADTCAVGVCQSALGFRCALPVGVTCRAASCSEGEQTFVAVCDGNGACGSLQTKACAPYACSGTACASKCATDDDCDRTAKCNAATGTCFVGASCSDDGSSIVASDGVVTPCSPYVCTAAMCGTSCTSVKDCATGYSCSSLGSCVMSSTDVATPSPGCSCDLAPRAPSSGSAAVALALGVLALRRRNRCIRAKPRRG